MNNVCMFIAMAPKANQYTKTKVELPLRLSQCVDSTSKPKFSRPPTNSKTLVHSVVGVLGIWSEFDLAYLHKDSLTVKCHVCTKVICSYAPTTMLTKTNLYRVQRTFSIYWFSADKMWTKQKPLGFCMGKAVSSNLSKEM